MRLIRLVIAALGSLSLLGSFTAFASVDDAPTAEAPSPKPDNTAVNKQGRDRAEPTADQASSSDADVKLAAKIRRQLMKDRKLSVNGHNVKIIAQNGTITLRGPVKTEVEKATIERVAANVAGGDNVRSELDVQQ